MDKSKKLFISQSYNEMLTAYSDFSIVTLKNSELIEKELCKKRFEFVYSYLLSQGLVSLSNQVEVTQIKLESKKITDNVNAIKYSFSSNGTVCIVMQYYMLRIYSKQEILKFLKSVQFNSDAIIIAYPTMKHIDVYKYHNLQLTKIDDLSLSKGGYF